MCIVLVVGPVVVVNRISGCPDAFISGNDRLKAACSQLDFACLITLVIMTSPLLPTVVSSSKVTNFWRPKAARVMNSRAVIL